MSCTVPETLEKLASHGSARQIAQHLGEQGVTGERRSATTCLVSEYMRALHPLTYFSVIPSICMRDAELEEYPTGRITWQSYQQDGFTTEGLPPAVDELACRFDEGEFDELARPEWM